VKYYNKLSFFCGTQNVNFVNIQYTTVQNLLTITSIIDHENNYWKLVNFLYWCVSKFIVPFKLAL